MNNQRPPQENKKSPFNFVLKPVGLTITIVLYILMSIFFSVIIEWVGMMFFWDNNHAQLVLKQEFSYLGDNFSTTILGISAQDAALKVIDWLNNYIFTVDVAGHQFKFTEYISSVSQSLQPYLNAMIYIIIITVIRCVIIALSSMMFIIIGMAAIVDGLHRRELRKLCGGIEYGGVYHRAKVWVPRAVVVSPMIYLAWPSAINPNYILLPGMLCFFTAIYISFATYKKYI